MIILSSLVEKIQYKSYKRAKKENIFMHKVLF